MEREPRTSSHKLFGYKILEIKRKSPKGRKCKPYIVTPYRDVRVKVKADGTAVLKAAWPDALPDRSANVTHYVVGGEGVHMYANKSAAFISANNLLSDGSEFIICDCYVPIGTEYWTNGDDEIAARELVIYMDWNAAKITRCYPTDIIK